MRGFEARAQCFRWRFEPDRGGFLLDEGAGFLAAERPAAERHNAGFGRILGDFFNHVRDDLLFEGAKVVFSILSEDFGDRSARARLDGFVAIGEGEAEMARELASDGRFAAAHHADQRDDIFDILAHYVYSFLVYSISYDSPHLMIRFIKITFLITLTILLLGLIVLQAMDPPQRQINKIVPNEKLLQ